VAAAADIAAPMIGRGTETPLFDLSRLAEDWPNTPQSPLERYQPPKGVPARALAINTPENIAAANAAVERGVPLGGPSWYNTNPLLERFVGELGPEAGTAAWEQWIKTVGATSPRSAVPINIRIGDYYNVLANRGELPEMAWQPKQGMVLTQPPPAPYGSLAQNLHAQNVRNVLSGDYPAATGLYPLTNPKPPSFTQNLLGNLTPWTGDVHATRAWGLRDLSTGKLVDVPATTEYGYMENLSQQQAEQMRMKPAQWQASAWLGAGNTGLKSPVEPFMTTLENRIRYTAEQRGEPPETTLRRMLRGEGPPLLEIGTAAGAGLTALLAQQMAEQGGEPGS
jgi:hypothetical protein